MRESYKEWSSEQPTADMPSVRPDDADDAQLFDPETGQPNHLGSNDPTGPLSGNGNNADEPTGPLQQGELSQNRDFYDASTDPDLLAQQRAQEYRDLHEGDTDPDLPQSPRP